MQRVCLLLFIALLWVHQKKCEVYANHSIFFLFLFLFTSLQSSYICYNGVILFGLILFCTNPDKMRIFVITACEHHLQIGISAIYKHSFFN